MGAAAAAAAVYRNTLSRSATSFCCIHARLNHRSLAKGRSKCITRRDLGSSLNRFYLGGEKKREKRLGTQYSSDLKTRNRTGAGQSKFPLKETLPRLYTHTHTHTRRKEHSINVSSGAPYPKIAAELPIPIYHSARNRGTQKRESLLPSLFPIRRVYTSQRDDVMSSE